MRNVVRKKLTQLQLGIALADVYVSPVGAGNVSSGSTSVIICNTDAAPHWITLRHGIGTLTTANSLFEQCALLANTTYVLNAEAWGITFLPGEKLQGLADVADVITVTIFGEVFN